jgi:hypothetical protein
MKKIMLSLALISAVSTIHAISFQDIGSQLDVQMQRLRPDIQNKIQELQRKAMEQANIIKAQQVRLEQAQLLNDQRVIDAAKREIKRAQELYNDAKKKITGLGIDTRKLGLGL